MYRNNNNQDRHSHRQGNESYRRDSSRGRERSFGEKSDRRKYDGNKEHFGQGFFSYSSQRSQDLRFEKRRFEKPRRDDRSFNEMENRRNSYRDDRRERSEGRTGYRSKRNGGANYNEGYRENRSDYEKNERREDRKPYGRREKEPRFERNKFSYRDKPVFKRKRLANARPVSPSSPKIDDRGNELIRLNKYIANSGVCSRREADTLIETGTITVNGEIVTELGYKVTKDDVVCYDGQRLNNERKVYILLNKPKGYITTMDDPQGRRTVLQLVQNACKERVYPVGRLDRNTTGLLLFTNDGDLAKKLMHPASQVAKIYHVETDKPIAYADMRTMLNGVELEDGFVQVDDIEYQNDGADKRIVGVEIHSGKNRIIRRLFESFGYNVVKLDRVCFAGLTKKLLPKGSWRFLTPQEVGMLMKEK